MGSLYGITPEPWEESPSPGCRLSRVGCRRTKEAWHRPIPSRIVTITPPLGPQASTSCVSCRRREQHISSYVPRSWAPWLTLSYPILSAPSTTFMTRTSPCRLSSGRPARALPFAPPVPVADPRRGQYTGLEPQIRHHRMDLCRSGTPRPPPSLADRAGSGILPLLHSPSLTPAGRSSSP